MAQEGKVKFRRGDLVRVGWITQRGVKKPLLGLVTGFNVRNDFNGNARTEVICRAFFSGLEYVVEPHQIEKVSK